MTKLGYTVAVTLILICLITATVAAALLEFTLAGDFTVATISLINITGLTAMFDDADRIMEERN